MDKREIIKNVNHIMEEGFEVESSLLKPEALLGDDLGLDSLDAVDLVVAIEKKFGFRIQEAQARSMRKLKEIYDYVEKRLTEKNGESGR